MKKRFKILSQISAKESTLCAAAEGTSAAFLADPICTALPYINANRFGFTREGLISRAQSMNMKPLNFMHEQQNIIGHINAAGHGTDLNGRTTAFASGVMYRRIFTDLVDQMVAKNGFDMFKVSIEASFDDISWILHDTLINDEVVGEHQVLSVGEDAELDDIGMLSLWLFGTLAGLKHRGRDVSAVIGGKNNSFEFVALAVTDELAGKAADQNTSISVFACDSMKSAHAVNQENITDFVLAFSMRDEAELEKFGVTLDQRDAAIEKFMDEASGIVSCSTIVMKPSETVVDQTVESEPESSSEEVTAEVLVLTQETSSEEMIPLSSAMRAQDKITRKYLRKISSLQRKLSSSEAEIANLKEALRLKAVEMEDAVTLEKSSQRSMEDVVIDISAENLRLRKFELSCLGLSDAAKEFEADIAIMSSASFADFKRKLAVSASGRSPSVNFEEQTRRVVSKK